MFFEIFKFELKYRLKRPATYIYFGILFLMSFLAVTTDVIQVGNTNSLVKENAPALIASMTMNMFLIVMLICSAVMGVSVLRDFEHNTESIMFSNPIKKRDYLLGRFFGSFVIMSLIATGVTIGFILGEFWPGIGTYWPAREADKMLPFTAWHYWQPFFLLTIPNIFFTGVLFFLSGTLSRKMLMVYTQGIGFFILYQISNIFTRDIGDRYFASIIDPMSASTTRFMTQYWTAIEQNTLTVPLEGAMLWNRLLWVSLGILGLFITHYTFNFNVVRNSLFGRKKTIVASQNKVNTQVEIPKVSRSFSLSTTLSQTFRQSFFYAKIVLKEIPFIAIVLGGLMLLFISSTRMGRMYGVDTYPTTYAVLELITGSFSIFFLIIMVFYSGELIWKERAVKINLIYDSMPIKDITNLIGKFLGLVMVYILMLALLIFCGIIIQTFKGYYDYQIGQYFSTLFTGMFSFLVLYTLLSMFIHVIVNHKFLGHAMIIVFFITMGILSSLGVEHAMLQFGDAELGTYSDMNGYGHFLISFSWLDFYWFTFSGILFLLTAFLAVRGSETKMITRFKIGQQRLTKPVIAFGISAFLLFTLSGCYIYYNTNVLHEYINSDQQEERQADYEKTLKTYKTLIQPKIVDINLTVDLYPENRDFTAKGYFVITNKSEEDIKDIHIQGSSEEDAEISMLSFEGDANVKESFEEFRYTIYELNTPLQPGDSIKMNWQIDFTTEGFKEGGSSTSVVYNGTFFNNFIFPTFGYNEDFELSDPDKRKEYDLPVKDRMLPRDDPRGLSMNLITDDADKVNFEIVMSTSPDQIAIAPGYLQREWEEDGRRYFHYKMDKPIIAFFSMVSARYEIEKDIWVSQEGDTVNLEIYYHHAHNMNLDRMMRSMKNSFDYFSENFSPYLYKQMRIMEFPRYATFAQSFANTVPFSEGIGFNLDFKEDDIDMAYYVTAHELAHQWWAHTVTEANVQGNAMLSETMSQYSALMVMKKENPPEMMQKFLSYELDRYLSGRRSETIQERPLELVESQGYIHYRKGSLVMYALQDMITEDSVNSALRRYIRDWAGKEDPYVSSDKLVQYFKEVTPDSLQYIITDMFETITLFENKTDDVYYKELENGTYEVEIKFSAKKMRADSIGALTDIEMNDWIDVGIYGEQVEEKDRLIYLEKHQIKSGESSLKINVPEKPTKAGIDVINKLIDRNPKDNTKNASLHEDVNS
ncbi:MAG: aminopeptidase [Reichenbachiella sp.]